MVESLSWLQWGNLLAALVLFMGPGFALLSFYPERQQLGKTYTIILSYGLSVAAWAILLAWFKLVGITLQALSCGLIMGVGWIIGLWRNRSQFTLDHWRRSLRLDINRLAIWLVAGVPLLVGLWGIRHLVVGMGSDSYHHTLIVQMIVDEGGLPSNYLPFAPLVTFSYHYGFHAMVAALDWLTRGIPARLLVPVTFEFMLAAAALAAAFMAESVTRSRTAGLVSAVVTGLVCVFPAFMGNWGRYTQLAGTILLALFLGLFWRWMEAHFKWTHLFWIAALAAGIALTHYRITLMALIGVLVLSGIYLVRKRPNFAVLRLQLLAWLGAGILAFLLGVPWLWLYFASRRLGYPVVISQATDVAFSISRLGIAVLNYPTNDVLLILAAAALVWGWLKRDQVVIWLTIWEALMLLLSRPSLLGADMDTISVIISSFVPLSVLLGWLAIQFYDRHPEPVTWLQRLVTAGLVILSLWGAATISKNIYPDTAMVWANDLPALEWVRANTPPDALFVVNTFHWDFNDEFIIGSDAGYWLPLLAGRQTVTLPMNYNIERTNQSDLVQSLIKLDQLNGELTTPAAVDFLRQIGASYIFIGEHGGKIDVKSLQDSPLFEQLYQHDSVSIFRFKPVK